MKQRHLQRLTTKDIQQTVPDKINTILFPVGTVEAHGAAALGTDNFIPESLADYLADKINALIAPTVNYGITKSLYGHPGSITVETDNYIGYMLDILKSFSDNKFAKVIILNGHGGNDKALGEIALRFHRKTLIKIAVINWWDICRDVTQEFFGEHGGHGANDEASMVQAVDESLVNKALYDDDMPYFYQYGAKIYPIPGSILLYKKNEGIPEYDAEKAKRYQAEVFAKMEQFVKLILNRWEKI